MVERLYDCNAAGYFEVIGEEIIWIGFEGDAEDTWVVGLHEMEIMVMVMIVTDLHGR